jgi:hypothetical protein
LEAVKQVDFRERFGWHQCFQQAGLRSAGSPALLESCDFPFDVGLVDALLASECCLCE